MTHDSAPPAIASEFDSITLAEFERETKRLNAFGPVVYVDDRLVIIEIGGLSLWCDVLALRLETALWCRDVAERARTLHRTEDA